MTNEKNIWEAAFYLRISNRILGILLLVSFGILTSCNDSDEQATSEENRNELPAENTVIFTDEQLEMAEIVVGKVEKRIISPVIQTSGVLSVPPVAKASVSAAIEGFVKGIYVTDGDFVRRGQMLATLQNQEYIVLQQEYLEAKNEIAYYREEFKRTGELTIEEAASIKSMQKAESDFLSREASMLALKARLELLGIDTEKLNVDGIVTTIPISAPISGYITGANASSGKFVTPADPLFTIIDPSRMILTLKVFEADIPALEKGQEVQFHLPDNPGSMYKAIITSVGKEIDAQQRTLDVKAEMVEPAKEFVAGMFVQANILTSQQEVWTLPGTAIIKQDKEAFIFTREGDTFKRNAITVGLENDEYTELILTDSSLLTKPVVTRGAYYFAAKIQELEE